MSWFPGAEIIENPTSTDDDDLLRTAPSPRPSEQSQQIDMEPDANHDTFEDTCCASWQAPVPQGLGLLIFPVTPDGDYDLTKAMEPYINHQPSISIGWPSEFNSSAPPTCRPEPIRRDSCSDQSCDPLSTLLPGALLAGYETSPGRSEYSRSSFASAVSSPYAHSDMYVHSMDSPQVKVEYSADQTIPQIRFVSEDDSQHQSQMLVNPGDLMNIDEKSIEERVKAYLSSSASSETGEYKPQLAPPVHRRARSFADFGAMALGARPKQKRTFTKVEDAHFRCNRCGKPFQRSYNLKCHISNVHNRERAKQHTCEYDGCGIKFVRKTDLSRHIDSVCTCNILHELDADGVQVHHKKREFKCELCGKDFPRKDTLTRYVGSQLAPDKCQTNSRFQTHRRRLSQA